MFKKFWSRPETYQANNRLETMLDERIYRTNPPEFFVEFVNHPLVALAPEVQGSRASFETTAPIEGIQYVYVYSSAEALSFALKKKPAQRNFVELLGKDLIRVLLNSGLGIQINADMYEEVIVCTPENLSFIAEQFGLSSVTNQ